MFPYNEQEVIAFIQDVIVAFKQARVNPSESSAVWLGRMQFDAVSMGYPAARAKHLAGVRTALGLDAPPIPQPIPGPAVSDRDWFARLVENRPFGQQTLLDLEPALNAAGWQLTPPNAVGDRTKVHPPNGPWVRVGFGEGHWVWLEQSS